VWLKSAKPSCGPDWLATRRKEQSFSTVSFHRTKNASSPRFTTQFLERNKVSYGPVRIGDAVSVSLFWAFWAAVLRILQTLRIRSEDPLCIQPPSASRLRKPGLVRGVRSGTARCWLLSLHRKHNLRSPYARCSSVRASARQACHKQKSVHDTNTLSIITKPA
jgi:hypothetical protein